MPFDRPDMADLIAQNPNLARLTSAETDAAHLSVETVIDRMPTAYFKAHSLAHVARHIEQICSLSMKEPYTLDAERISSDTVRLTIITIDDPGILSLLTGLLGAAGFDITEGTVFTMSRASTPVARAGALRRTRGASRRPITLPHRRIVDQFVGRIAEGIAGESFFSDVTGRLDEIITRILPGGDKQEARRIVNEAVAARLRSDRTATVGSLYPIDVAFDESTDDRTVMVVRGEDTPFFLYSLSASLSIQQISIESVTIETHRHSISDRFELSTGSGEIICDPGTLDRIRFSVLLTKQFTFYLGVAPDPYVALIRFETLSGELIHQAGTDLEKMLRSPHVLRELAQLLGASDFLWEDFIRLQYETLLPMLSSGSDQLSTPPDLLAARLSDQLAEPRTLEERVDRLNEFKDRESYLIDLDHILQPNEDFFFLSHRLSALAEVIVTAALDLSWASTTGRYGVPRTVAGLEPSWAVFGLGKLGGRALGYASDIELLFVYSDNGMTDGEERIQNAEFFDRFFSEAVGFVRTKREGIFAVDLRLRPHGSAGPLAVSLESFNRYYGRGGDAHSYERLALTRLRFISGDRRFGERLELLRDDLIYASDSIDLGDLRNLRGRQFDEKNRPGETNAKFSPGGLVDLEYGLQILLVQHGRTNPVLRTRSMHSALEELGRSGLMEADEVQRLTRSYQFLRKLINGLRMLRGNAKDLFLPSVDSLEYEHLARRMGYHRTAELTAAEQLHVDFEARTAGVRAFVERHLGRESIPGKPTGNAADLVLSHDLPAELIAQITAAAGLTDPRRAINNLRALAGSGEQANTFAELVILVWSALRTNVDADMALNNWERFVSRVGAPLPHFRQLLQQPRKLELMLRVFATSQFLADTLVQNPPFLEWSLDSSVVNTERRDDDMLRDLASVGYVDADPTRRRSIIRVMRKREILRIATRDICLGVPVPVVTRELSALARAFVQAETEALFVEMGMPPADRKRLVILAFGKLGGDELNYSSDIDLLGIYADGPASDANGRASDADGRASDADGRASDADGRASDADGPASDANGPPPDHESSQKRFAAILERLRANLSDHTTDGYAYRVDFRLRPYGSAGPLVQSFSSIVRYYRNNAAPWEHQALLKLRPVAGNIEIGLRFLEAVRPLSLDVFAKEGLREGIERLRSQAILQAGRYGDDVKNGVGGIRDIEFLIQGLQMVHAARYPEVVSANTLDSIGRLAAAEVLTEHAAGELAADYVELRRLEHFLQIFDDRQIHSLPVDAERLTALARRTYGRASTADSFTSHLASLRVRVRGYYQKFIDGRL